MTDRAGWYLPRSVERFLPPSRRALRHLDPQHVGGSIDLLTVAGLAAGLRERV